MKRAVPWSDEEEDSLSDESWSSHSDLGADDGVKRKKAKDQSNASQPSKDTTSKGIRDSFCQCLTRAKYKATYLSTEVICSYFAFSCLSSQCHMQQGSWWLT